MTRKASEPTYAGTVVLLRPNGLEYGRADVEYVRLNAETVAGELVATVRNERGWSPIVRVLDEHGRDITAAFQRLR